MVLAIVNTSACSCLAEGRGEQRAAHEAAEPGHHGAGGHQRRWRRGCWRRRRSSPRCRAAGPRGAAQRRAPGRAGRVLARQPRAVGGLAAADPAEQPDHDGHEQQHAADGHDHPDHGADLAGADAEPGAGCPAACPSASVVTQRHRVHADVVGGGLEPDRRAPARARGCTGSTFVDGQVGAAGLARRRPTVTVWSRSLTRVTWIGPVSPDIITNDGPSIRTPLHLRAHVVGGAVHLAAGQPGRRRRGRSPRRPASRSGTGCSSTVSLSASSRP